MLRPSVEQFIAALAKCEAEKSVHDRLFSTFLWDSVRFLLIIAIFDTHTHAHLAKRFNFVEYPILGDLPRPQLEQVFLGVIHEEVLSDNLSQFQYIAAKIERMQSFECDR